MLRTGTAGSPVAPVPTMDVHVAPASVDRQTSLPKLMAATNKMRESAGSVMICEYWTPVPPGSVISVHPAVVVCVGSPPWLMVFHNVFPAGKGGVEVLPN